MILHEEYSGLPGIAVRQVAAAKNGERIADNSAASALREYCGVDRKFRRLEEEVLAAAVKYEYQIDDEIRAPPAQQMTRREYLERDIRARHVTPPVWQSSGGHVRTDEPIANVLQSFPAVPRVDRVDGDAVYQHLHQLALHR